MPMLFIVDQPPRRLDLVRETVDMVLAALALEERVAVAFVGDGVYHCLAPQSRPERDPSAAFGSLHLYDVERLLIERESLSERGLRQATLRFEPELVSRSQLRALMRQQDVLL